MPEGPEVTIVAEGLEEILKDKYIINFGKLFISYLFGIN